MRVGLAPVPLHSVMWVSIRGSIFLDGKLVLSGSYRGVICQYKQMEGSAIRTIPCVVQLPLSLVTNGVTCQIRWIFRKAVGAQTVHSDGALLPCCCWALWVKQGAAISQGTMFVKLPAAPSRRGIQCSPLTTFASQQFLQGLLCCSSF